MPTKRKKTPYDTSPEWKEYHAKYLKEHYKFISIRVSPEKRDQIAEAAKRHDMSIAQYVVTAAEEYESNHPVEKN